MSAKKITTQTSANTEPQPGLLPPLTEIPHQKILERMYEITDNLPENTISQMSDAKLAAWYKILSSVVAMLVILFLLDYQLIVRGIDVSTRRIIGVGIGMVFGLYWNQCWPNRQITKTLADFKRNKKTLDKLYSEYTCEPIEYEWITSEAKNAHGTEASYSAISALEQLVIEFESLENTDAKSAEEIRTKFSTVFKTAKLFRLIPQATDWHPFFKRDFNLPCLAKQLLHLWEVEASEVMSVTQVADTEPLDSIESSQVEIPLSIIPAEV